MKDAEREVGNDMFTQKFMQEIERSFEAQLNRLGERRTEVEAALVKCSNDEAEALKCLYASMPVSDAADYEAELFLSYVFILCKTWSVFMGGRSICRNDSGGDFCGLHTPPSSK